MSETLSETEACDLLSRLFRSRGYAIKRNVLFREYGVEFHADGWDEKARVGFEFLTSEDDDHDDLSLEEYKTLSAAQQRGELSMFILDEVEPLSAADLVASAGEFLDEVEEAAAAVRPARPSRSAPAKKTRAKPSPTSPKKGVVKGVAKPRGRAQMKKAAAARKPTKKAVGKKKKAGKVAKKVAKRSAKKRRGSR